MFMSSSKKQQPSQKSYFDLLKFEPHLMDSFAGKYLKNLRLMFLLLLSVLLAGVLSYTSLSRTLNPDVNIPFVVVSTALPGAGPQDVEELVTIPLEKEIKRVKNIDTYTSSSQDNVSLLAIQFKSSVDAADARDEVQSAIDSVNDLPDDATDPQVMDLDFENVPAIDFVVHKTKNTSDRASLHRLAQTIEDRLEDISEVDRVEKQGQDERQIEVLIKPEFVQEKGIQPPVIAQAISAQLSSYPAGKVTTDTLTFPLTIDQPVQSITDLRSTVITLQGMEYRLEEVAQITEQSKPNQAPVLYFDEASAGPHPAIKFSVYKTSAADVDKTAAKVQTVVQEVMQGAGDSYQLREVTNYADLIDRQFGDLIENFYQTLILVFLSMFVLYGIRQASIASLAIPVALLIVFMTMQGSEAAILQLFGFPKLTLNFLTIFSLLIALGLFVDNAVVIIEAYTSYYRTDRFTPLQTAILVWRDFWLELFSINLLTVWAFLPLLITTGIIGEFITPLPIIVSVAMMGSVGVALFFTLPAMMLLSDWRVPRRIKWLLGIVGALVALVVTWLLIPSSVLKLPTLTAILFLIAMAWLIRDQISQTANTFLRQNKSVKRITETSSRAFDEGFISLKSLRKGYRSLIHKVLVSPSRRWQVLGLVVIFTIFSYALIPLGFLKQEFFPMSDQEEVYVEVELPAGSTLEATTAQTQQVAKQITDVPEMKFAVIDIQAQTGMGFDVTSPGTNKAVITLKLTLPDERERSSLEIEEQLREQFSNYQAAKVQISQQSGGPPAGADLEIKLLGPDLDQLQVYAQQLEKYIQQLEGATNVRRSITTGTSKLVFVPNQEELQKYGVNEQTIGMWLRTMVSGFTLDTLNQPDEDLDITLRLYQQNVTPEELNTLQIPVGSGRYVPLEQLGSIKLAPNPTIITREDGQRSIKVQGSVLPGYQSPELNQQIEQYAQEELSLAPGYSWSVGGVNEENQQSIASIVQAMGISAILILATMVLQLGSFRKAIIVMLVIPLAISGVFIWFSLTATPLSFPAMIGLLSLFGIVIANSLMIVDKITQNQESGMDLIPAITDASASRLEPIALTSISQIIGLIPVTLADPLWRGLGGSIIAGLSFSGTIMLLFVPIVYYYFFRSSEANS